MFFAYLLAPAIDIVCRVVRVGRRRRPLARGAALALIDAARYATWLAVTPVLAAVLLTVWPSFRRSTLRVLPRGHLAWRGEEYLHDVNSALAGYIRAQSAAAAIVGVMCVSGFVLIGV